MARPARRADRPTLTPKEPPAKPSIDVHQDPHEVVADALACAVDVRVYPFHDLALQSQRWAVVVADVNYRLADFGDREAAFAWARSRGLPLVD